MKGKFYGVGVGVGDEEELTLKAVRILKNIEDERTQYALEEIEKNILVKIKEDY